MARFVGLVCTGCKTELFAKSYGQVKNAANQIGWKKQADGHWLCNDCIVEEGKL